jgi:hypothetical protein
MRKMLMLLLSVLILVLNVGCVKSDTEKVDYTYYVPELYPLPDVDWSQQELELQPQPVLRYGEDGSEEIVVADLYKRYGSYFIFLGSNGEQIYLGRSNTNYLSEGAVEPFYFSAREDGNCTFCRLDLETGVMHKLQFFDDFYGTDIDYELSPDGKGMAFVPYFIDEITYEQNSNALYYANFAEDTVGILTKLQAGESFGYDGVGYNFSTPDWALSFVGVSLLKASVYKEATEELLRQELFYIP